LRIQHGGTEVRLREKESALGGRAKITELDRIRPLLAGLNRVGCRGGHCQWWVTHDHLAPEGDCALVVLAGAMAANTGERGG